jgi:DNA-binding response OmpR family regulator
LLIDRDDDFARATAEALRREGHQVRVARHAAAATELALAIPPDVVVLDATDGDAARELRRSLPSATPIIALSQTGDAVLIDEVDMMLHKPVPPDLFGGLLEYVRRRRAAIIGPR